MRRVPKKGQNPPRSQLKTSSLSWPPLLQRTRRKSLQDSVRKEGVELVFDELRQVSSSVRVGLSEASLKMLLHQARRQQLERQKFTQLSAGMRPDQAQRNLAGMCPWVDSRMAKGGVAQVSAAFL